MWKMRTIKTTRTAQAKIIALFAPDQDRTGDLRISQAVLGHVYETCAITNYATEACGARWCWFNL
jgi:hypothetical protein